MAYREIDRSTSPNTGQGDSARTWASKTNENMKELFSRSFVLDGFFVKRNTYDPNDPKLGEYLVDDVVEGFADVEKTRFVKFVVLAVPFDLGTGAGVFMLMDNLKVT